LLALCITPFFYVDSMFSMFMHEFHRQNTTIDSYIKMIVPIIGFIAHGTTLMVGSFLVCLATRSSNRKIFEAFKTLLIGLITSGIVVQTIKHLAGRARPRITDNIVFIGPSFKGGYDSFPSGHTTLAFCLAYILSSNFPRYRIFFYAFAVITALHRLEGPAHFITDVLTGALLGTVIGKGFAGGLSRGEPESSGSLALD